MLLLKPEAHQLVVFAVDGLTTASSTARYMPRTHVMADKGLYASFMRTTHDTARSDVAWVPSFYASSTSEFGCDNNGCNILPRMLDEMPNWLDILETDHGYSVTVFSQNKPMMDNLLDRNAMGFRPMEEAMKDEILGYTLPATDNNLVLVHFSGLDRMGEVSAYDSINYKAMASCTDIYIDAIARSLWEAEPNATTFVLMTNHGGHGYRHDQFEINVIQVPFMMWGRGIAADVHVNGQPLQTIQIGPTILDVLGFEDSIPDFWIEAPIQNIKSHHGHDGIVFSLLPPAEDDGTFTCDLPWATTHEIVAITNTVLFTVYGVSMLAGALLMSLF